MSAAEAGVRPARGLIVAAPASGSGKTTFTLGLLHLLARRGGNIAPAKVGPDYIDPAYHAAAAGRDCINLDTWMQRPQVVRGLAATHAAAADLVVCEGVMGLFDGAAAMPAPATEPWFGDGSTADLAATLGWPIILVVDVRRQGASVAALVEGFVRHRRDLRFAGVVLNRIGSAAHTELVRGALVRALPDIPVLGALPDRAELATPHRHLGLVQAAERRDLAAFLTAAADHVAAHCDIDLLLARASPAVGAPPAPTALLPPLGQVIAVARDAAFAFAYPAILQSWREQGAEICHFSPLDDQAPPDAADAVYLPGGYPELHAPRLAACTGFLTGLRAAAGRGAAVYGECGGYMVLGSGLVAGDGGRHAMAGLLPVTTSFASPRRHLGYRTAVTAASSPLGAAGTV